MYKILENGQRFEFEAAASRSKRRISDVVNIMMYIIYNKNYYILHIKWCWQWQELLELPRPFVRWWAGALRVSLHMSYTLDYHVQWAKKPIFKRANFACESNCSPEDKVKPVGICGNKAKYHVLCCAKQQTFGPLCWFDIGFWIHPTQPISFFAHIEIRPRHVISYE